MTKVSIALVIQLGQRYKAKILYQEEHKETLKPLHNF